ncbi:hypothetical protein BY996DRAFT_6495274 [Phakopsora pachyrhizi]|nr:hypothetical protein BY996DRAFT_6495274 [Phakopsora pachyrhizi]
MKRTDIRCISKAVVEKAAGQNCWLGVGPVGLWHWAVKVDRRARRYHFRGGTNVDDWKKVIWTDETSFEVGKKSHQVLYEDDCVQATFRHLSTTFTNWSSSHTYTNSKKKTHQANPS